MTVIVHKSDGTWERYYGIEKIQQRPGWIDLYQDQTRVGILATASVRLEVSG